MRILVLVQYFNLPGEPGGSRAYQFARRWRARGHEVTILTGNVNYKTGRSIRPAFGRSYRAESLPDGVRVLRLWTYERFQGSFRKRLLFFASYALNAAFVGTFLKRPDVVFASSTPITVGLPGWWLSRRFRVPFVFELRDLWPEAAVAAGVLRDPGWIRRIQSLARFLYRKADHLVAVTRGIRDGIIAHGTPPEKISLLPNGVDDWMVAERFRAPQVSPRDPGGLRCLYVGAHGLWNNLETLLAAARALRKDRRVEFVFIGDGDRKGALRDQARREGLDNVRFLDAQPKEEAFASMVRADLGLIAASDHPHNRQTLPNKIFDYLAAELPVLIAAGEGEMRELLEISGGGWSVPPEDGEALAAAIILALELGEERRRAVGRSGQKYVLEHYARTLLADEALQIFSRLTGLAAGPELANLAADPGLTSLAAGPEFTGLSAGPALTSDAADPDPAGFEAGSEPAVGSTDRLESENGGAARHSAGSEAIRSDLKEDTTRA